MGLRDFAKRLTASVDDIDDERKRDRFEGLSLTPLDQVQPRVRCIVGGEVSRTRITPRSGVQAFEITIDDGKGTLAAVFTGRRHISGMEHHRGVVLEGVPRDEHGHLVMLNPAYTLLP